MTSPSKTMSQEVRTVEEQGPTETMQPAATSLPPQTASLSADGSPKKRACEENPSSPSNKKVKEADAADGILTDDDESVAYLSLPDSPERSEEWLTSHVRMGKETVNDVLLGKVYNHRPGNKKYNVLLASKKVLYLASTKAGKNSIVMEIIQEVRSHDPPGRFLEFDGGSMYRYDVGDEVARKNIMRILGKGSRPRNNKQRDSNESNTTMVSHSGDEEGQPSPTSVNMHTDVLSFLASTPFDGEAMLSLHSLKEHGIVRESLILPSCASLPILPQKQFLNTKAPAMKNDHASPKSSPYVENEVSKFLLEEAVNLASKTLPPKKKKCRHSSTKAASTKKSLPQDSSIAKLGDLKLPNGVAAPIPDIIGPKLATASKEMNTSDTSAEAMAKMPVVFGFNLDDNGASKHMAQAATENWKADGTKAAKKPKKSKLRVSIDGRASIGSSKNGTSACMTPKMPKTPKTSCDTPKTPKTPALLLSTKAVPNLPDGWIAKKFQRTSGKTAGGTDTYFYSPKNKVKFRSQKGCNMFIQILDEPGVEGNEASALKMYKERGHRF